MKCSVCDEEFDSENLWRCEVCSLVFCTTHSRLHFHDKFDVFCLIRLDSPEIEKPK